MTNQAWWPVPAVLAALGAALLLARRLVRLQVTGVSMLPTLAPGDRVLIWRGRRVHAGDLVAFTDPGPPPRVMIKRIWVLLENGDLVVVGDNTGVSVDSRDFGPVRRDALLGRVVYRYFPEFRAGWLVTRG